MAGPFRSPQKYTFHTEMRGARGVITNLNAISRALDATRLAATKTFQIDKQIRTLTVEMGGTADQATRLAQASLGMASATGSSVDSTSKLITAYQRTGRVMGGFGRTIDNTTNVFDGMTQAQHRSLRAQANLVDLFGISAAQVVELNAQLHHLGLSMDDMLGATAKFQTEAGIPGLMKEMTKTTGFAFRAISRFNRAVVGSAPELIQNVTKVGAVYAKAYGVDISKGIDMARKQQERFIQQAQKDRDVFLGLSDTFDGLTMSIMEGGFQFEEVQRLIQVGREDPIKYAETIRQMRDQIALTFGSQYAERWFEQIRRQSDESTQVLLTNTNALRAARHERDLLAQFKYEIPKAGLRSYEDLVGNLRDIGAVALQVIHNLTGLFKTIVGTAFTKVLSKAFQGAIPALRRFNDAIARLTNQFVRSHFWMTIEPYMEMVGRVLIGVGAAAGVLASALASTIIPFKLFISAIRAVPLIGKTAAGGITGIGSALFGFARGAFTATAAVTGIGIALNDFGRALKVMTREDKAELVIRGFRAMAIGIVETFDGMLGGIPTWIAKQFFPEMVGTLGDNVKLMFQKFQIWFEQGTESVTTGWWGKLKLKLHGKLVELAAYLRNNWEQLEHNAIEWGSNIGRAIGTLANWAWQAIVPLFDRATWSGYWHRITDYFSGRGKTQLEGSFGSVLDSILTLIGQFGRSMIDEILRPWNMGWIEAKDKFLDFYDEARIGINWMTENGLPRLNHKWTQFKVAFVETALAIKTGVEFAFNSAKGYFQTFVGHMMNVYDKVRRVMLRVERTAAEAYLKYQQITSPRYLAARAAYEVVKRTKGENSFAAIAARGAMRYADPQVAAAWSELDTAESALSNFQASTFENMEGRQVTAAEFLRSGRDIISNAKAGWRTGTDENQAWIQKNMGGDLAALQHWDSKKGREEREAAGSRARAYEEQIRAEQFLRKIGPGGVGIQMPSMGPFGIPFMLGGADRMQRDMQRSQQDQLRAGQFAQLEGIRRPYIERLQGFLSSLESLRASASDADKPKFAKIHGDIERALGSLRDAQNPQELSHIWSLALRALGQLPANLQGAVNPQMLAPLPSIPGPTAKPAPSPQAAVVPQLPPGPWSPEVMADYEAGAEARRTQQMYLQVGIDPNSSDSPNNWILNMLNFQMRAAGE